MHIKDSVFIVTGGASGLGEASVRRIVAGGGRCVIADIQQDRGRALVAELGAAVRFCKVDVTSDADCQAAVDTAFEAFGNLTGVVNCAGIGAPKKVLGRDGEIHSSDYFMLILKINLFGSFNMLRLAAAKIAQQNPNDAGERGVIINTASVAAYDGQIGQAAYAASKGGIVGMTLPLAREFARSGIRVVTIAPGLFETPLMMSLPEEARQSLGAQVPFPSRLGYPDEFAQLVQSVIENPMLNGETIRLDGAIRMAPK